MLLEVATVSLLFLVAILVVQFIKMKTGRRPEPILTVQNWTPDMVYLCQFPPSPKIVRRLDHAGKQIDQNPFRWLEDFKLQKPILRN